MAQAHGERKLTAILNADVVGFSRLMGQDDAWTVQTLHVSRDLIRAQVVQHGGRVVDVVGDNLLAGFPAPWRPFAARSPSSKRSPMRTRLAHLSAACCGAWG